MGNPPCGWPGLRYRILRRVSLLAGLLLPSTAGAEAPFINMLFPPPGFVGPREDPNSPHEQPPFPVHATQCQESGTAKVTLTIGADGRVSDVTVVESTGYADLDAATVIQVGAWRYLPATKDAAPTAVRVSVTIPFVVEKHGPDFAADCTAPGTQAAADALWRAARKSARTNLGPH
jgi:TonB family protein